MQTTYSQRPAQAVAGMLGDLGPWDIFSSVNQESSAAIPFGVVVKFGTLERTSKLLAAADDMLQGIVIRRHWYDRVLELDADVDGVKAGVRIDVLRRGRIWVPTATAAALTAAIHTRYAGTGTKGAVRNAAVTDETIDISHIAKVVSPASGSGLVELDVNFINF